MNSLKNQESRPQQVGEPTGEGGMGEVQ